MKGHQRIPLTEVLTLKRDEVLLEPEGIYRTAGIYSFGKGVFEREPIRGAETSYRSLFRLHENQFVVSRLKGWEGAVDVVGPDVAGCLVSNEYPTFSIDTTRALPSYLRWIAHWPTFWDSLVPRGSIIRRGRVHVPQLLNLEIPLPSIEEQCSIAEGLDRAAMLLARGWQDRSEATKVGEALFRSRSDALFSDIDAELRPLRELAEVKGGIQRTPSREAGGNPVRYLTVAHVGRDTISVADPRFFEVSPEELQGRALRNGDVLIIEGNGSADQIGRAALFRGEIEPCVHQNHVIRARPTRRLLDPEFLNDYLNSPAGRRAVQAQARTSSGLRSLSVGRINMIEVPVPSLDIQQEVVEEARRLKRDEGSMGSLTDRFSALLGDLEPSLLNQALAGLT